MYGNLCLMKNGQEAIDYFQKMDIYGDDEIDSQIELVILDLNLPIVDGIEVLNNPVCNKCLIHKGFE